MPCFLYRLGFCPYIIPGSCFYFHSLKQRRRYVLDESGNIKYSEEFGIALQHSGVCLPGDDCEFAHNEWEVLYHPVRFRTKMCNKPNRRNYACCFGHGVVRPVFVSSELFSCVLLCFSVYCVCVVMNEFI